MANLNVTYTDMSSAAGHLSSQEQAIDEQLTALQTYIRGLVSSGFVTEQASVKFGEDYDQFTAAVQKAMSTLTDMATYLNKAATALQDTDQALARGL